MSRFKSNYEALDEQKWAKLKDSIAAIPESSFQDNAAAIAELERLVRVTETVADAIGSVQPFAELINPDIQNHVKSLENHLANFKRAQTNQKAAQLTNLNNAATNILERVWPFLSKSDAARSAGQAFSRYRILIETEEKKLSTISSEADEAIKAIRAIKADLSDYRLELLEGTDQKTSIKGDIEEKLTKIDGMLERTDAFYTRLTQGDAEAPSIENQIVQAKTSASDNSSKIAEKLTDAERKLKELDRTYAEVVGATEDDEEDHKGLKAQLEDRKTQLETIVDEFGKKFHSMVEQVEGLLPGATSAGLATAYSQLRSTAETRAWRYSAAFFSLVAILTVTAAATVTQSFSILPPSWEAVTFSDTAEYFTKLLFKLPVVIPVLWAALTVSKRRSEMHRLAEEYAHKEALAKSYEGFKKQIIELESDDKGLMTELLAAMLSAVSLNAAETLEGKHGEKMPVQEVIEETVKSAAKQMTPSSI